MLSRHWRLWLSFPSPPRPPSPEERLAFGLCLFSCLVPPVRLARLRWAALWSRRLTEPPRPANVGAVSLQYWFVLAVFASADASLRCNGRGGSVSRRDLDQLTGDRAQLAGGTTSAEAVKPIANRSSGGSAREGLLSEKPPPSHSPVLLTSPVFSLSPT